MTVMQTMTRQLRIINPSGKPLFCHTGTSIVVRRRTKPCFDVYGYYRDLRIEPSATYSEIRAAVRAAERSSHPDHGGDVQMFMRIQEAKHVLLDPVRREAYDGKSIFDLLFEHADARYIRVKVHEQPIDGFAFSYYVEQGIAEDSVDLVALAESHGILESSARAMGICTSIRLAVVEDPSEGYEDRMGERIILIANRERIDARKAAIMLAIAYGGTGAMLLFGRWLKSREGDGAEGIA